MRENWRWGMFVYVFWLGDTVMQTTDRQIVEHKDGSFRLSISNSGKRSVIKIPEKAKYRQ